MNFLWDFPKQQKKGNVLKKIFFINDFRLVCVSVSMMQKKIHLIFLVSCIAFDIHVMKIHPLFQLIALPSKSQIYRQRAVGFHHTGRKWGFFFVVVVTVVWPNRFFFFFATEWKARKKTMVKPYIMRKPKYNCQVFCFFFLFLL